MGTYPATTTPIRRKTLPAPNEMSEARRASTTLKSAVNRFRIRPNGTVSIHLRGVRRMVKLRFSNSRLEARMEPVKT